MTLRQVLIVAIAVSSVSVAAQSGEKYSIRLERVPVANAREGEPIRGRGTGTATLSGNRLTVNVSFEGLATPATVARLHRGVAKGARGPVLGDLTITKGTSGIVGGTIDLQPQDLADLKLGRLYVQVHSEKGMAPDGHNLWGWLLR
jgi:hypothetical protein